jgi:hypothetical protein
MQQTKQYCFQLTTGLIFKTLENVVFDENGRSLIKGDHDKIINGSLFTSSGQRMGKDVQHFLFKASNIIASWED